MRSNRPAMIAAAAGLAFGAANADAQSSWAGVVSDSWFNPARWTPAGVPNAAGTSVTLGLAGAYTVSMQNGSATCGTLTISNPSAVLNIFDNAFLNVAGNISNSSLIQISGPGAPGNTTRLQVAAGAVTISGSGTLRLASQGSGDSDSAYLYYTSAANVLTNAAGHTIAGAGRFYANLSNNGTVNADQNGKYLLMIEQPKTNAGTMTASGGGVLQFRNVGLTQTGSGQLVSSNDSPVQLSTTNVSGGLLNGAGTNSGVQYFGSNTVDAVTMQNLNAVTDNSLVNIGAGGVINNGTWTVSSPTAPGNLTRIQAAAPAVTVGGTGTIRLQGVGTGDNDSAFLYYTAVGNVLTNGASHSIKGYGRVYTNLVNNGSVNADVAGKALLMIDQPKTNNGTMTASNGGVLQFRNVSVTGNPAAQVISTDAASPVQMVNATMSGGGFTTGGTGVFQYFGNNVLSNLTVNGTHQITDNSLVNMTTDLVNNGTWKISDPAAPGNLTRLTVAAPAVTISGTGSIILQGITGGNGDNTSAYLDYSAAGNVLTLGSGQSVTGYGRIYPNLVNNGSINANVSGKGIFFVDQPKTNSGTITASNGGFVQFRSVAVTGTPGTQIISTDASSPVQMVNSSLSGGGFTTSGTGLFQYYGNSVLSNLTVNGTHQITDNSLVNLNTNLVNNGTWKISDPTAPGNLTRLVANAPAVTISGTGSIILQGIQGGNGDNTSAYLESSAAANVLTLGSGQTVSGYGRIYANLVNNGTINANNTPNAGGPATKYLVFMDQPKTNNATITASNGGAVYFRSVSLTQGASGVVSAPAGTTAGFESASVSGGTLTSAGSGVLNNYGSSSLNGVTLSSGSLLQINDNTVLSLGTSGLVNNGTIAIQTIPAPGNLTRLIAPTNSNVSGTGSIKLQAVGFGGDSAYIQGQGDAAHPLTLGSGQTVTGTGRFYGNIVSQGRISPDQPFGTPTQLGNIQALSGSLTMASTSILDIQIASTSSYDSISGNDTIAQAGALTVTSTGGYVPAASHIFTIVSGSSVTGTFSPVGVPVTGSFGPAHVVYTPTATKVVMCYANCDGSSAAPTLNVNDFNCFLNSYAAGDPYANCDGSTIAPVLNVNDFSCFLNKYAAGCS